MFIPTKADLEWLDTHTDYIHHLTDMELIELINEDPYKDGYKIGQALVEEYKKRFWNEQEAT